MATPAPALKTLKAQLLKAWPNMGAANLGIMADAAHIAGGTSDHIWGNALDIPVKGGPGAGAPMKALADALLADSRAHYVIYNRLIRHKGQGWVRYYGTSSHTDHIHLSIIAAKRADASTWSFTAPLDLTSPAGVLRFFRLYHATRGHFYTSTPTEVRSAIAAGYRFEGVGFDVSLTDPANTVPLHRFLKPDGGHFFTANATEAASVAKRFNYRHEGAVAMVNLSGSGTAVSRYFIGPHHLLTTNPAEHPARHEGTAFWTGK